MAIANVTPHRLCEVLHYDPETGFFTWLVRASQNCFAGARAGSLHRTSGYRSIQVDGKVYPEHRLAVLYMTQAWPLGEVDHLNGVRADNRWCNLRDATKATNMQNKRKPQANNVTGFMGVCFNRRTGRYATKLVVGGIRHYFGTFDTPEEAHAAYLTGKRLLHPGNTL